MWLTPEVRSGTTSQQAPHALCSSSTICSWCTVTPCVMHREPEGSKWPGSPGWSVAEPMGLAPVSWPLSEGVFTPCHLLRVPSSRSQTPGLPPRKATHGSPRSRPGDLWFGCPVGAMTSSQICSFLGQGPVGCG